MKTFDLDWKEFLDRNALANPAYEMGEISLDESLHLAARLGMRAIQFEDVLPLYR